MSGVRIFGQHDEATVEQMERCVAAAEGARGVLCADGHLGYSQPIGGVVAYREHVSPSGVGYDIACGNKAAKTGLRADDVVPDVERLAGEIQRRISFGVGRQNDEPVDHSVLDLIGEAVFAPQRQLRDLAAKQLGTVGAGNHYVDLFSDEDGWVWVGVHFGSRGFGHKTANGFLALSQGLGFDDKGKEGEMQSPPVLLRADSGLGEAYIQAMTLAGRYAYAGRDVVVDKVLEILGAAAVEEVHNHHNFAWREHHGGETYWVVRKGATPAQRGQRGFVGGSMGDPSVILEGTGAVPDETLSSTVHGAGRAMSRTKAAGKFGKVYECTERDCLFRVKRHEYAQERERRGLAQHERFTLCPDHPEGKMKSHRARVSEGLVDFAAVQAKLAAGGIVLRGGAADEAPQVYKRLPDVLAEHAGTIRVLHTLTPLAVVMAGADTFDPYRD